MRDRALSSHEQVLALATKRAITAAGGIEVAAAETGKSMTQLSRCNSPNHPDSIALRDALTLDSIGRGHAGSPFIIHAFARLLGGVFVELPQGPADADGMIATVMQLTSELGDVARRISDAFSDDGKCDADEARGALAELDQMDAASARLRLMLNRIVEVPKAEGQA